MYMKCEKHNVMDGEPHLGKIEECELVEEDGEGLDLIIQYIADNGDIPTLFYAVDDYSEEQIELVASDYIDDTFINWYENKVEFDEDREFTFEELLRVVNGGLTPEDLRKAVHASVVKLGENIEGYVDHNDLYLQDDTAQKIIEKGVEALWDITCDWNLDYDDSYYDDHKAFIIDYLKLTESEQDEYEDEIKDAMRESIFVSFDYDKALDYTEVKLNVAYAKDWDYVYGWQSVEHDGDVITDMPDEYDEVLKLFGYDLKDYIAWHNTKHRPEHKFYESFLAEIDNSGQGFTEIVFLLKMSINDVLKLKEADTLVIGTNVSCGMFDHWNGGGSILELDTNQEILLDPKSDEVTWRVDGQDGNYDVDSVYGLCGDAWSTDFKIEKEGGEDEEDDG